jgi:hypothetical protein
LIEKRAALKLVIVGGKGIGGKDVGAYRDGGTSTMGRRRGEAVQPACVKLEDWEALED